MSDLEDLEKLDASEICPRSIAKEVLKSHKGGESIFSVADAQQNCQEETMISDKAGRNCNERHLVDSR